MTHRDDLIPMLAYEVNGHLTVISARAQLFRGYLDRMEPSTAFTQSPTPRQKTNRRDRNLRVAR